MLQALDRERLRKEFASSKPYPFVKIDNFLAPEAASEIADAYPAFEIALDQGRTFTSVNERKKIQITNSALFPPPVARLNNLLASPQFLRDLGYITGMPQILADDELVGGGIHITGPGGRLDVHVDFNYIKERKLHRRLNLLLYLNPDWQDEWGGQFQLWDAGVKRCEATFSPIFNRCVIFETSNISFHGVVPVSLEAKSPRKSFAAYYYTPEAPAHWTGEEHSTIFVARPEERYKKYLAMPAESIRSTITTRTNDLKGLIKSLLRKS
jgi:2OG-Fe(II) oxygenase superfamily